MTRRGGRWRRVALRLGLLLGGVVVAWGVHEAATTAAAYAADRPPAAPVDVAVDLLSDVLRPIFDTATPPPASDVPADETAPGTVPSGADLRPAPARPADQVTPSPARPVQVGTPKPAADGGSLPNARPDDGNVLAPVSDLLNPVTEPVRAGVLVPVADVLSPVTQPLTPVLSPIWQALAPVLEPLDPVLQTLDPVTDLLEAPSVPPATPPMPAEPPSPTGGVGGGVTATGPVGESAEPVSGHAPTSTSPGWHTSKHHVSPLRLVRSDGPYPPRPDADTTPAMPASGTGGSGSTGTVHGDPGDAATSVWRLPSLVGCRCHPTGDDVLPSRSPRPGTRPA